ncbi:MAG: hypothetical protein JNK16_16800, partial [Phycisphaerales bacterium]|nr:hypothetical protein [Phycisphaerales bacterium]
MAGVPAGGGGRGATIRKLLGAAGVAFLLTASGCSNADRIQKTFDNDTKDLISTRDSYMKAAEQTTNPGQMKDKVFLLFLELQAELQRAKQKAESGDIEGAQRDREALFKKLRDLIPGFENLKDFINPKIPNHLPQSSLALDMGGYGVYVPEAATARGVPTLDPNGNGVYMPAPSEMIDYSLSGFATLADATDSFPALVSGEFNFTTFPNDEGFSGRLNAGEIEFITGDGWFTLTSVNTDFNTISMGGDGQGTIEVSLKVSASNADAAISLPLYVRLRIPIAQTSYGWRANFPATPLSLLAPKPANPIRDYNKDGVLDFATDYAAF